MNALDNANIKDENSSGFASFAFPEAKSSKTGVSVRYVPCEDKAWYVLRIKYGQAQTVADALIEDGTYVYLAKIWKDIRNKETGKKQRKLFPFMNRASSCLAALFSAALTFFLILSFSGSRSRRCRYSASESFMKRGSVFPQPK